MDHLMEFEAAVEPLENAIRSLRHSNEGDGIDILNRIQALRKERDRALKKIYAGLTDWQVCQVARHPNRPQFLDYVGALFDDFFELHGDRLYADDRAIIGGVGRFEGTAVMIIGQQKGAGTHDKITHNFGMPNPEGYRKALRMMDLAEKFRLPIVSFIDTPGAYPGIGAEERGQAGAIGMCLRRSAELKTPYINLVIGEGGSGGALALAVGDCIAMLEYAIYSVISPEGCASILWKDAGRAQDAAALLHLTAAKLKKLKMIDEVLAEPVGGAHRNAEAMMETARGYIRKALQALGQVEVERLLEDRYERWRRYGVFKKV